MQYLSKLQVTVGHSGHFFLYLLRQQDLTVGAHENSVTALNCNSNLKSVPPVKIKNTMFPATADPHLKLKETPKLFGFLLQLPAFSRSAVFIRVLAQLLFNFVCFFSPFTIKV